jgi:hypothetical protein
MIRPLGLPCQVPRALNLTVYLLASACLSPHFPIVRLFRRDLLFLSPRSLLQVVAPPYEAF